MNLFLHKLALIFLLLFTLPSTNSLHLSWTEQQEPYIRKSVISKVVSRLWLIIDSKCIGAITRRQARDSVSKVLEVFNKQDELNDRDFYNYFKKIDKECEGAINKEEFVELIDKFVNGEEEGKESEDESESGSEDEDEGEK